MQIAHSPLVPFCYGPISHSTMSPTNKSPTSYPFSVTLYLETRTRLSCILEGWPLPRCLWHYIAQTFLLLIWRTKDWPSQCCAGTSLCQLPRAITVHTSPQFSIVTLKLAIVGVFTPQKLASESQQSLVVSENPWLRICQHTTGPALLKVLELPGSCCLHHRTRHQNKTLPLSKSRTPPPFNMWLYPYVSLH